MNEDHIDKHYAKKHTVIGKEIRLSKGYTIKYVINSNRYIQKKKNHQKSKLPLVLSAGIAATLITSSLVALPSPFSYIIAIAIAGPLSASLLGLRA